MIVDSCVALFLSYLSLGNTMMNSFERLLGNIHRYVILSESEQAKLLAIVRQTRIRKRQFIDQPGYVCGFRNYVVEGAFRSYYVDEEGKDHTVQIALEDWFVSDFYSYITQTPATLFVEALEDAYAQRPLLWRQRVPH